MGRIIKQLVDLTDVVAAILYYHQVDVAAAVLGVGSFFILIYLGERGAGATTFAVAGSFALWVNQRGQ